METWCFSLEYEKCINVELEKTMFGFEQKYRPSLLERDKRVRLQDDFIPWKRGVSL
jgi:hypothetical protein